MAMLNLSTVMKHAKGAAAITFVLNYRAFSLRMGCRKFHFVSTCRFVLLSENHLKISKQKTNGCH